MALLLWASLGALGLALWKLIPALLRPFRSPVRSLPGPPSPSWLWGQSKKIFAAENSVLHQEWIEKYGNVLTYTGFLNINRLYTHDMRALNHVLTHSADFQKPEETRTFLTRLLGAGVLVTEGDQHRQQRRVMVRLLSLHVRVALKRLNCGVG
ncbi:hypothetical protein QCA50_018965 [Cerrena zonata]|uniref:Uncharacterized protein n=1 Tax=Cerrena zonata TaxID=2478898 RepID=A0AAW0FMZ9_9APHY